MLAGRPIQILLVEHDLAHAEIARRNLEDIRVANTITHLRDGQATLDYCLKPGTVFSEPGHPWPNLVLLDLCMPKVDGLEVLRQLKADPQFRRVPMVILTSSKAEQDIATAYDYGACSYLVKAVDFPKFTALLEAFGFCRLAWNQFPTSPFSPG